MDRSIKKWRNWLEIQQSVTPENSAIAAAGKQAKPATLEITPLVLVPDEKPELTSGATRRSDDVVNARSDEQISLLARLRDAKGNDSTEALALAIPKLSGDIQQQTRDALIERLNALLVGYAGREAARR